MLPRHTIRDEKDSSATNLINHPVPAHIKSPIIRSYEYVTRLEISKQFFTFIFRTISVIDEKQFETRYYIANIDSSGILIRQQPIAAYINPQLIQTATIYSPDSFISISDSITWQRDPLIYGFTGNVITAKKIFYEVPGYIDLHGDIRRKLGKVVYDRH